MVKPSAQSPLPEKKDTGKKEIVDTQTRHALKQDSFVTATQESLDWASDHRKRLITVGIAVAVVLLVIIVGAVIYQQRSAAASEAFGNAMQTYQAPLSQPGQQVPPSVQAFASIADRAKAANKLFLDVADKYSMTPDGRNARYFAGLTYMEMGQNAQAETTLKDVADSMNKNVAALGKLALASLYHQTGRNPAAIDLLNQLATKPTDTVPAGMAKLQLASLYESSNQPDEAKRIYAQLKDQDKTGAAGQIAAQKLSGAPQQP